MPIVVVVVVAVVVVVVEMVAKRLWKLTIIPFYKVEDDVIDVGKAPCYCNNL